MKTANCSNENNSSRWRTATVNQLVAEEVLEKPLDGNHGGKHPKGEDFVSSGIPFIMATDINKSKIDLINCSFITKKQADSLNKGFSVTGDVLLTHKATLGRTAIVGTLEVPYIMLTPQVTYYRIKNPDVLDRRFLKYYFDSPVFQDTLANHGDSGSTRAYVGITAQGELPITFPRFPEQRAIADILSSLDDKIDLLHRQNKTLESLAETLFRQWFIEEAQPDWKEGKLGDYVNIGIGRTPPRNQHQWFSSKDSGDVKWISIKDMAAEGVFLFDSAECLTKEAVAVFNIPVIPPNTVLLSFKMTVGRVGIITEPMLSNEAIAHFVIREDTPFTSEYLYLFLKSYQYDLLGSTSSIVTAINSTMIKELEISIPPQSLMQKFTDTTRDTFQKIKANQQQIKSLELLRDTLLPKLMNGDIQIASVQL